MGTESIERIERAIEELRAGRMVIVVDDEDRENEGDLVMAAEKTTPEAVNFMAKHGRGLICLSLTEQRVRKLALGMMVEDNTAQRSTAFTVSIEARKGVTTGISAADRARTILTAVAEDARPSDLASPGHIFPLRAVSGGVLRRAGHTEGSVDLARLAGCAPAGVICEVMNDDGTMARRPDLERFAQEHALHICSIADLIQYRLQRESLVFKKRSGELTLGTGTVWTAHVFGIHGETRELVAFVLGEVDASPTLLRVHTGNVLGDVFGVQSKGRLGARQAMRRIEQEGRGVLLFVPGPHAVEHELWQLWGESVSPPPDRDAVLREFGIGAQVIAALGLRALRLLTNRPRRIAGLEGYGLELIEQLAVRSNRDG